MNKPRIVIAGLLLLAIATAGAMYIDGQSIAKKDVFYIVSNTEYWSGETGQVVARFVNFKGDPITVNNCTADILYPNQTYFVQAALMSDSAIAGDHYYAFTVPATEGVYDYKVVCNYGTPNKQKTASKTFHVNPALNKIKILDNINNTVVDIQGRVINLNTTLTSVYDDTQYLRTNFLTKTEFQNNMTVVNQKLDDIDTNLSILMQYCSNPQTNTSDLCALVHEINNRIIDLNTTISTEVTNYLAEINATTHSTYDYLTGTLTTTINNILGITTETNTIVKQINNTVNTIDTRTQTILSNTSQILENQQNADNLRIIS